MAPKLLNKMVNRAQATASQNLKNMLNKLITYNKIKQERKIV